MTETESEEIVASPPIEEDAEFEKSANQASKNPESSISTNNNTTESPSRLTTSRERDNHVVVPLYVRPDEEW